MKAKGAAILIRNQTYQNNKIFVDGFQNKSNVKYIKAGKGSKSMNDSYVDNSENLVKKGCMIYPYNGTKTAWDLWVMLLLVYTALFVPYQVCFMDETSDGLFMFGLIVDASFLTDVVITFFTAIDQSGKIIDDRGTIAKNYFKLWFWIDFFSSIPFQLLEKFDSGESSAGNEKALRLARLPRLYRLIRILRLVKMFRITKMDEKGGVMGKLAKLSSNFKTGFKIALSIMFINHLMCCAWYFQAKWQEYPSGCWVRDEGLIDASN